MDRIGCVGLNLTQSQLVVAYMSSEMLRTPEEVLTFKQARRRLKVSAPVFEALLRSKLLGAYDPEGWVQVAGIESYERYGTQWNTDVLGERMLSAEFVQNMSPCSALAQLVASASVIAPDFGASFSNESIAESQKSPSPTSAIM